MNFKATQTTAIVSHGVDVGTRFGVQIESDDSQVFTSDNNDVALNANNGFIVMVASEGFVVSATEDIYISAGDSVIISTGFTVEPNFQIPFRTGILFASTAESSYRSNKGSIHFYGEDSSWTLSSSIDMRSGGDAFFGSSTGNVQWTGSSFNVRSSSGTVIESAIATAVTARDGFLMQSRGSTTVYSSSSAYTGTTNININGEDGVLFTTPLGFVDMGRNNVFKIPRLNKEAGISGHRYNYLYDTDYPYTATGDIYRTQEENQYPICVERSFGWDSFTNAFCYCDFNKWRCIDSIGP